MFSFPAKAGAAPLCGGTARAVRRLHRRRRGRRHDGGELHVLGRRQRDVAPQGSITVIDAPSELAATSRRRRRSRCPAAGRRAPCRAADSDRRAPGEASLLPDLIAEPQAESASGRPRPKRGTWLAPEAKVVPSATMLIGASLRMVP